LNVTGPTICLFALLIGVSDYSVPAPLFEGSEVLDVVIEAPLRDLSYRRHRNPQFAGTFRYTDASGAEHALSVMVTTRGKSRLEVCDYPPLKIIFNPDETAGTLFEGQRNLKLVRQCMRSSAGRDWVYLEYGVYRAYNIITDYSFRARQINVTYRDTKSRRGDMVQPGFFLEDDSDVAKRLGRKRIRPPIVKAAQLALVETTHNLLFQYLIGNTDFAVKRGPKGEGCCHNGRVIAEAGQQNDWVILPYDFDFAGLINTSYSLPDERLPIKRVTMRLYRGFCWQNDVLPDSIRLFNQKRSDIEVAMISPQVSKGKARRVNRYFDRFYEIINDPQELKKRVTDKCRGPDSLPLRESPVSPGYLKTP